MFSKACKKIEKAWPIYYLHPPSYLHQQQAMYICLLYRLFSSQWLYFIHQSSLYGLFPKYQNRAYHNDIPCVLLSIFTVSFCCNLIINRCSHKSTINKRFIRALFANGGLCIGNKVASDNFLLH